MAYSQLAQAQRYQIYELKQSGLVHGEIASQVCVQRTTVLPELRRKKRECDHRPHQAHGKAMERWVKPRRPPKLDES